MDGRYWPCSRAASSGTSELCCVPVEDEASTQALRNQVAAGTSTRSAYGCGRAEPVPLLMPRTVRTGSERMDSLVAFISYAHEDGGSFAHALVEWLDQPERRVTAWIDRDSAQRNAFETRIENAIIGAHVVIVVVTPQAVADGSWAREELLYARDWNRTRIAVRPPGMKAQLPLSMMSRPCIDLDPEQNGWNHLEHELELLRPADGVIADLAKVQEDLERRAEQASGAERNALRASAGAHSALLQQELRRRRDPSGAERAVRGLIAKGQRNDAARPGAAVGGGPFRVVDSPPTVASVLHDRRTELRLLLEHLGGTRARVLTLRGPLGAGKTALVGELIRRLPEFDYAGVTYTSTHGPRRVTPELLLEKLARAHSDPDQRDLLLERLVDSSFNWHQNMTETLARFAGLKVLVVIDDAEELLDRCRLVDPNMREFMHAMAYGPKRGPRLMLVSQVDGPCLVGDEDRTPQVDIPASLPPGSAEELLRGLDVGGGLGLRTAPQVTIDQIYRLTGGRPGQLELIYGVLCGQGEPDIDELLRLAATLADDDPTSGRYLARRAVSGLNEPVRQTLQALAIYDRPVRAAAVSWLLAPYYPGFDSTPALELLCDRRIARRDGDLFSFSDDPDSHAVLETVLPGDHDDRTADTPRFTRRALLHRAADYFREVRLAVLRPKSPGDLAPFLTEIDLRLAGGQHAVAAVLVDEIDLTYLSKWQHRALVVDSREAMVSRLMPDAAGEINNRYDLATIHLDAGRPEEAMTVLTAAIELAWSVRPRSVDGLRLQVAKAHYSAGRLTAAVEAYWEVLPRIAPAAQAVGRIGLASCLTELGRVGEALDQYVAALEVAPSAEEAYARLDMGLVHQDLGDPLAALDAIEAARRMAVEQADAGLVAGCDDAEAYVRLDWGEINEARALSDSAIRFATDTGNVDCAREAYFTLALAHLLAGDLDAAHSAADAAARFFDNERPLAPLALLGITQLRLRRTHAAQHTFLLAAREADRLLSIEPLAVQVLDIKGLALAGLAACDPNQDWEPARRAYQKARERTCAPGIVLRAARLLDALVERDRSAAVMAVIRAVRGDGRRAP